MLQLTSHCINETDTVRGLLYEVTPRVRVQDQTQAAIHFPTSPAPSYLSEIQWKEENVCEPLQQQPTGELH